MSLAPSSASFSTTDLTLAKPEPSTVFSAGTIGIVALEYVTIAELRLSLSILPGRSYQIPQSATQLLGYAGLHKHISDNRILWHWRELAQLHSTFKE